MKKKFFPCKYSLCFFMTMLFTFSVQFLTAQSTSAQEKMQLGTCWRGFTKVGILMMWKRWYLYMLTI